MNIFATTAPAYYALGIPVIPCAENSKKALPTSWSSYSERMPDEATREEWMRKWPNGNIGVVLGQQSGMVALDLDTDDVNVARILDAILPHSPWVRRGKKGSVRMYRYTGQRTFRIIDMSGKPILELLAKGSQVILPPSIHPDTMQPYSANCELASVYKALPALPDNIETILRESLVQAGVSLSTRGSTRIVEFVAAGARDSTMTAMAGLTARAIIRGERTLNEAFEEMTTWVSEFVQQVAGDPLSVTKAHEKIVYFLKRDVVEGKKALPKGWDGGLDENVRKAVLAEMGEDGEQWDMARFMQHLTDEFTRLPSGDPARMGIIDAVLVRLGKQQNLSSLEIESILSFIHGGTNRQVGMSVLRKRLKEVQQGEFLGLDHAEIARELLKELSRFGEVRFENEKFWRWCGACWKELEHHEVLRVLAEEFGSFPAARRASDHRGILSVLSNVVTRGLASTDLEGINFANGFLTVDGELLTHDPKFGCRYVLPYRYVTDKEGHCPKFLSFLHDSWGHEPDFEQRVMALQEAISSTLFGVASRYSRAFCLYGVPHSGKSTLMRIILGLIPEDASCSIRPQTWGDRFAPIQMAGKLLNFCGELSEEQNIAGDRFKQIVEGDMISGEYKGKDMVLFKPTCAHWFCSNHLPNTRDSSSGFNRRWLFFPFTKATPIDKKVNLLELDILGDEREAIVAWAMPAIKRLRARHEYTLCKGHVNAISEMASKNNSVRYFFSAGGPEVVPAETSKRTSERELYTRYFAFCRAVANARPVSLKKFRLMSQELQQELGFQIHLTGQDDAEYHCITLVQPGAASHSTSIQ